MPIAERTGAQSRCSSSCQVCESGECPLWRLHSQPLLPRHRSQFKHCPYVKFLRLLRTPCVDFLVCTAQPQQHKAFYSRSRRSLEPALALSKQNGPPHLGRFLPLFASNGFGGCGHFHGTRMQTRKCRKMRRNFQPRIVMLTRTETQIVMLTRTETQT